MRRHGSILVIGNLAVVVASCGQPPPRPKEEQRTKIGLPLDTSPQEASTRHHDLFLQRAKELGSDVLVEAAEGDDAKQLQLAQSLLERGVAAAVDSHHSARS